MSTVLVERNGGRWEFSVRECSHSDDNKLFATFEAPIHGGAAVRTETKGNSVAFVADANILVRLAIDLDGLRSEPRLSAEDTARAPLAGEAMADGDSDRLFGCSERELTATTRCNSRWHSGFRYLLTDAQRTKLSGRERTARKRRRRAVRLSDGMDSP